MPAQNLTMNRDDMELTLLELMVRGEDILPHGAWESPVKRLAMKGYASKIGSGYRITDKGRAFFMKAEGLQEEDVAALEPPRPDWLITDLPDGGGLVVLRKNEMTVSGYEALAPHWVPVVHGKVNEPDTVAVRRDVDGFLQAVLDAAWAKGLRPTNAA